MLSHKNIFTGITYLNKIYIPHELKPLLIQEIPKYIDRKISIQSISYNPFKGFIIKNFKIFEEISGNNKLFLNAEKIKFNILFLPILKSKKIVIPAIYIYSPEINIKFKPNQKFNIPFFEKNKIVSSRKIMADNTKIKKMQIPKMKFVISNITVKNGKISIQDQTKTPFFHKTIKNANIAIYLSLPKNINFTMNASTKESSNILLKGKYKLYDKSFSINTEAKNISIPEYNPYIKTLPFTIANGKAKELKLETFGNKRIINNQYSIKTENIKLQKNTYEFSGTPEINGDIKINLLSDKNIDYKGLITLKNGVLQNILKFKKIKDIKGKLSFSENNLKTDSLTACIQDSLIKFKGQLNDFDNPKVELFISGFDNSDIQTEFYIKDKTALIEKFNGNFLNSTLKAKGNLHLQKDNVILTNCNGDLSLDFKNIKQIEEKIGKKFQMPNLKGILKGSFNANGSLNDIRQLNISFNGNSNQILFKKFRLTDILLQYNQKERKAKFILDSQFYNGNINLSSDLMLEKENISYFANINAKKIDLSYFKKDTQWENKELSGELNLSASLNGRFTDLPKTNGTTQLKIIDGNLWEIDLLKGITKILSLPKSERIKFKEVYGDFFIKKDKAYTENLKFIGDNLKLIFLGNFDFSGKINFDVLTTFTEKFDETVLNKIEAVISSILTETQRLVGLNVTGTFKNPKYNVIPTPQKIFKGFINLF